MLDFKKFCFAMLGCGLYAPSTEKAPNQIPVKMDCNGDHYDTGITVTEEELRETGKKLKYVLGVYPTQLSKAAEILGEVFIRNDRYHSHLLESLRSTAKALQDLKEEFPQIGCFNELDQVIPSSKFYDARGCETRERRDAHSFVITVSNTTRKTTPPLLSMANTALIYQVVLRKSETCAETRMIVPSSEKELKESVRDAFGVKEGVKYELTLSSGSVITNATDAERSYGTILAAACKIFAITKNSTQDTIEPAIKDFEHTLKTRAYGTYQVSYQGYIGGERLRRRIKESLDYRCAGNIVTNVAAMWNAIHPTLIKELDLGDHSNPTRQKVLNIIFDDREPSANSS